MKLCANDRYDLCATFDIQICIPDMTPCAWFPGLRDLDLDFFHYNRYKSVQEPYFFNLSKIFNVFLQDLQLCNTGQSSKKSSWSSKSLFFDFLGLKSRITKNNYMELNEIKTIKHRSNILLLRTKRFLKKKVAEILLEEFKWWRYKNFFSLFCLKLYFLTI